MKIGKKRGGGRLTLRERIGGFVVRTYFRIARRTIRLRVVNDRRDQICYHSDRQFIYAILHAQQVAALVLADPNTGALVSRSRDGELIVPLLKQSGCVPIRGSSGEGRKGGASALSKMIRHVQAGHPAVIAVDGPKGPRGKVQKGIALLAQKTGVPILPVVMVPKRRHVFKKAWDRLQLPFLFTQLDCRFGDPIYATEADDLVQVALKVENSLRSLEWAVDPKEAAIVRLADLTGSQCYEEAMREAAQQRSSGGHSPSGANASSSVDGEWDARRDNGRPEPSSSACENRSVTDDPQRPGIPKAA